MDVIHNFEEAARQQLDVFSCPSCGRRWAQPRTGEHAEIQEEPITAFCSHECEDFAQADPRG